MQFFPLDTQTGPMVFMEPSVAGAQDVVTVVVQAGITSGLSNSGVSATLSSYDAQDVDFASPTVLRTVKLNAVGLTSFRTLASNLATGNKVLGVSLSNARSVLGFRSTRVSTFGQLATRLDDLLCAFRNIPRFEEPGRVSEDGTRVMFGWGNWHLDPDPVILKNSNTWLDRSSASSNYAVDYSAGSITLANPLVSGEEIRANYSFRLLDLAVYENLFGIALDLVNARKPQTSYLAGDYPAAANGLLLLYAYAQACMMIIPKLSMFRFRRLFENPDQLLASLQANLQLSSSRFDLELASFKKRGLTQPAAVSSFDRGRTGMIQWDGINVMEQLVIGSV